MGYSCIPLIRRLVEKTKYKGSKFSIDIKEMSIKPEIKLDKDAKKSLSDLSKWFINEIENAKIDKQDIKSIHIYFKYSPKRFLKLIKYYKFHSSIVVKTDTGEIKREIEVNGWI